MLKIKSIEPNYVELYNDEADFIIPYSSIIDIVFTKKKDDTAQYDHCDIYTKSHQYNSEYKNVRPNKQEDTLDELKRSFTDYISKERNGESDP